MFGLTLSELYFLALCLVSVPMAFVLYLWDKTRTHKPSTPQDLPFPYPENYVKTSFRPPSKPSSENTSPISTTHFHCVGIYPNGLAEEFCCGTRFRAAEQARVCLTTGMNTVFLHERSYEDCLEKGALCSPSLVRLQEGTSTASILPTIMLSSLRPILHPVDQRLLELLSQDHVSSPLSTTS